MNMVLTTNIISHTSDIWIYGYLNLSSEELTSCQVRHCGFLSPVVPFQSTDKYSCACFMEEHLLVY